MRYFRGFRHWDLSDIFTYDMDLQSVVDKMVREISLEVRERSWNYFSNFGGNPESLWWAMGNFVHTVFKAYCGVLLGPV